MHKTRNFYLLTCIFSWAKIDRAQSSNFNESNVFILVVQIGYFIFYISKAVPS